MRSYAKIKPSRKCLNIQYLFLSYRSIAADDIYVCIFCNLLKFMLCVLCLPILTMRNKDLAALLDLVCQSNVLPTQHITFKTTCVLFY